MISIQNVSKKFGNVYALKNVNLQIETGEKIVIIGPSGSGKSTLIRSINGLEHPTEGTIVVDGIDVTAKKVDTRKLYADVAMVFQDFNLYPHKTVLENVTIAPIHIQHLSLIHIWHGVCDRVPLLRSPGTHRRNAAARPAKRGCGGFRAGGKGIL